MISNIVVVRSANNRIGTARTDRGAIGDNRRGLTLLELLLVLVVVVAAGALVFPAVARQYENQTLRQAGELLRAEWAAARNTAMRTGQIQVFRAQANEGNYRIESWSAATDVTASENAEDSNETRTSNNARPSEGKIGDRMLPNRMTFVDVQTEATMRDTRLMGENARELAAKNVYESPWSIPLMFYPDGSSTTARVVLANRQGYFVQLDLRGLTGSARASDLMNARELARE